MLDPDIHNILSQYWPALPEYEDELRQFGELAEQDSRSVEWHARDALERFADAAVVTLRSRLADKGGEHYSKLARLYARRFLKGEAYPSWVLEERARWLPDEAKI